MAISYVKIARTPYVFRQLTGLTTSEFQKIVAKVRPEWEKEKKRHRYSVQKIAKNNLEFKRVIPRELLRPKKGAEFVYNVDLGGFYE